MNTNFITAVQNELLKHGFKSILQKVYFSNAILMPVLIKRNDICESLSFNKIKQILNNIAKEYHIEIVASYVIHNGAGFYFIGFDDTYTYRIEFIKTTRSDFELDACTIDVLNAKEYV